MSAALALSGPEREAVRLVVAPEPVPKSWQHAKHYRRPDPELLAKFQPAVVELLRYARQHRLKAIWFTFTSRAKGPTEAVRRDLKRCWARFRHCSAWRRILGAVVVHATHGRPHIHILAILPDGLTPRAVYGAWGAGYTNTEPVSPDDAEALARYCAAQRSRARSNAAFRHRSFTIRRPPPQHLDSGGPWLRPAVPALPTPAAIQRAGAGGGASSGEGRSEGQHAGPSASEEPKAAASVHVPEAGPELSAAPPHRGSEPHLRLVPLPLVEVSPMPAIPASYIVGDYTRADIEIAMLALRPVLPRESGAALSSMSLASAANIHWNLAEEALMRLLFVDQVKRKKDRRLFVYWAGKGLPSPVPVVVPERLRMFMTPDWRVPRSP